MTRVTVHAAKTQLSKLIAQAEAGEEIVICRGDKPVAKLTSVHAAEAGKPRAPGRFKGKFTTGASFDDEVPDEFLLPRRDRA